MSTAAGLREPQGPLPGHPMDLHTLWSAALVFAGSMTEPDPSVAPPGSGSFSRDF